MTLTPSPHRTRHPERRVTAWMSVLALLLALLFAGLGAPVPLAAADDDNDGIVSISIDDSTAVVTDDSGYSITLTVTNGTDSDLEAGTLTLSTNAAHVFMSRTDIQDWAQADSSIPVPDTLGTADVEQIDAGDSASVTIDVPYDNSILESITTWGPKPLRISYTSGDDTLARVFTFFTRSQDGLQTESTPALGITVVMPLTGTGREVDDDACADLIAGNTDVTSVTTLTGATQTAQNQTALLAAHDGLQAVADPTYLDSIDTPFSVDAIMQPAGFDITAYSQLDSTSYETAGITTDDWNADAALAAYSDACDTDSDADDSSDTCGSDVSTESDNADDSDAGTSGDSSDGTDTSDTADTDDTSDADSTDTDSDQSSHITTVAWQGEAQWTLQALTTARQQGYEVVIADSGFDDESTGTVHTGKYEVPTDAGTVTVLAAQSVLTGLAQGQPTSESASGEQTEAGRLARFVAQSAFYQMEQPYTTRNLLVCLDADMDAHSINALMDLIEESSWLELTDLQTLIDADAYLSGEDAGSIVPDDAELSSETADSIQQTLDSLTSDADDITRLSTSVLADDDSDTDQSDQNADESENSSVSEWITALETARREFALQALGSDETVREKMVEGSSAFASDLLGAVSILPLETMTVVSETASMPVTVHNNLPYAVNVTVSSITDSSQIVTSREASVTVPPNSETQVTFTIRVVASGTTTAHLTLLDRDGTTFGDEQSTDITSSLRISDMSGFVIIALAVVLGLCGLWRQFHRKKDPDE